MLVKAVANWDDSTQILNHARALARLDWRWRFKRIAAYFGRSPKHLDDEIAEISAHLTEEPIEF